VLQERRSELAESRGMMYSGIEPKAAQSSIPLASAPLASAPAASAPRAGADLHTARERIGWSLPEMAAALHIRLQYLEALEAGRIGDLPGNAYTLGFVRTYASALGLDPNEIARRLKAEAAGVNRSADLAFPMPAPQRGMPAGAVALLGIVLAVGAYAGWYRLSGEGRLPAETSLQVPARLASLAEQAMPPHAPSPAPMVRPAAIASAGPTVVEQPEGPSVPSISPASAAAAVTPPPAPADQSRILLRANADAWVQVRDRSGPVLLSRTLHAGETWAVPLRPNLLLTTGNAGGTDLLVDGAISPPLGGNGVVRRDLALDPDLIRDGRLAATSPPASGVRSNTQ
jgi:cytoskeleton protein RodZ